MGKQIFRQVALERLSSPEQLDQLIKITTPQGWLALIALGCLVVTSILWGIFGTIPTKVNGEGLLIKGRGISEIIAPYSGQITDIRVKPGDQIKRGQVVARVEQIELIKQINEATEELKRIKSGEISGQTGLIEQKISHLRDMLELDSRIVSTADGRVLEVKTSTGSFISAGTPVVSYEATGESIKDLEVILFIPVQDGKKIQPGMEVQFSPSTVKKEEYGFMLGRVISVSKYPVTNKEMMQVLGNEELVRLLSGQGAPVQVRVDLIPDVDTPSGFKWSSREGPAMKLGSGTLGTGSITIKEEHPISMAIPVNL